MNALSGNLPAIVLVVFEHQVAVGTHAILACPCNKNVPAWFGIDCRRIWLTILINDIEIVLLANVTNGLALGCHRADVFECHEQHDNTLASRAVVLEI